MVWCHPHMYGSARHEIGVVRHIDAQRRHDNPVRPPIVNRPMSEGVQHRRSVGDGAFVSVAVQLKTLMTMDCHEVTEKREHHSGVHGLRADKQMVSHTRKPKTAMATLENAQSRTRTRACAKTPRPAH